MISPAALSKQRVRQRVKHDLTLQAHLDFLGAWDYAVVSPGLAWRVTIVYWTPGLTITHLLNVK